MPGFEPEDFAGAETRPDAGEEAECEERHRCRLIRFHEFHEVLRERGGNRLSATPAATNPIRRNLGQWIFCDPVPLQRELEEARDDAAAIVVGLACGAAELEIRHEPGGREVGDRYGRAAFR